MFQGCEPPSPPRGCGCACSPCSPARPPVESPEEEEPSPPPLWKVMRKNVHIIASVIVVVYGETDLPWLLNSKTRACTC